MRCLWLEVLAATASLVSLACCNPDAKRLYSNLLANYDRSYIILLDMTAWQVVTKIQVDLHFSLLFQAHPASCKQHRQTHGLHETQVVTSYRRGEWLSTLSTVSTVSTLSTVSKISTLPRTCGGRSWRPTCGCSRSGLTTSSPGTRRITAGSSSSTCPARTSGCRTSCYTTSRARAFISWSGGEVRASCDE